MTPQSFYPTFEYDLAEAHILDACISIKAVCFLAVLLFDHTNCDVAVFAFSYDEMEQKPTFVRDDIVEVKVFPCLFGIGCVHWGTVVLYKSD